jgi:hypothetical protein
MHTVTSFPAAAVPPDQLSGILADYLALDRARMYRRLLTARCGLLALVAAAFGALVHGPSLFARWIPTGMLLVPPAWAWISELRIEYRRSRRLEGVDGAVTRTARPRKKVIKSP